MSWKTILKKRGKGNPVWKPMSSPKIKTNSEIKLQFINKTIKELYNRVNDREDFDMSNPLDKARYEWILKFYNAMSKAFKENKKVEYGTIGAETLEDLKKLTRNIYITTFGHNGIPMEENILEVLEDVRLTIDGEYVTFPVDSNSLVESRRVNAIKRAEELTDEQLVDAKEHFETYSDSETMSTYAITLVELEHVKLRIKRELE